MFKYYDDADVQIVGLCCENMTLKEMLEAREIIENFNNSMRYENVIKRQNDEKKQLKVELLEEKLKNAKYELNNEVIR